MKYDFGAGEKRVTASVRDICGFLFRSGDVYSGGTDVTGEAMRKGTAVHRKLQSERKKQNAAYECEKRMCVTEEYGGFTYELSGIADGLYPCGDASVIDEFKTAKRLPDELCWDTYPAYGAQLKMYGYMYCELNSTNFITLRLSFYGFDGDETRVLEKEYTFTELRNWFVGVLAECTKWAELVYEHRIRRNESIQSLDFPFGQFRKGQRALAAKIYRCVRDEKRLFAQAPTGIGKTVSALFPSVKAMGEGNGEKIFYLSAKTVGAAAADDCVSVMCEKGLCAKSITLTAKDRICPFERNCLPSECAYSKGHYDRVNTALFELVSGGDLRITKETLSETSKKHSVCPFELQLDASEFCDIVIGDYNYFFDPKAHIMRFFDVGGDYTVLVDEAHNLADRAREMYTSRLSYLYIKSFFKHFNGMRRLTSRLSKCLAVYENIRERVKDSEKEDFKLVLTKEAVLPFVNFCEAYEQFLSEDAEQEKKRDTLELYFEMSFFTEIYSLSEAMPEYFTPYIHFDGADAELCIMCTDPSELIALAAQKARSTVFFSATLSPFDYYLKTLGYGRAENDEIISVPSPFPKENFLCCVYKNISTKLSDRNASLETACEIIHAACCCKNGNYMAFFPSYSYMNDVLETFNDLYPEIFTVSQKQNMTSEERAEFLRQFNPNPKRVMIAFALCGGVFSEGVDLVGDRLSGVVVIGTGLPSICFERNLLREHYDKLMGEGVGYNYAYTYTGLNRVFQAGGRVIRTAEDKGFVVLADERYMRMSHRRSFPDSWRDFSIISDTDGLKNKIETFWK